MPEINPSLDESREILAPRMLALTQALSESVKAVNNIPPPLVFAQDRTARATDINRVWYYLVNYKLGSDSGVQGGNVLNQRYVVFDERLILRHKLLDNNLVTRNYNTRRSVRWNFQMPLDDLPKVGRLNFGYRLDLTGTFIKDAFVTLPFGDKNLWIWQVWGDQIDNFGIQMLLDPTGNISDLFSYDDYIQTA